MPCVFLPYKEATTKTGGFLTEFMTGNHRISSCKVREQPGWEARGRGVLEEIGTGSYGEVVEVLEESR